VQEESRQLEQEVTKSEERVRHQISLPPHQIDLVTDKEAAVASITRQKASTNQGQQDGGLASPALVGKFGSTEFALPTFEENKGMNPQLFIGQLKELVQFRGIRQLYRLTVAKKSVFPLKI
jgi:ABC-type Fe2+-enterobactin transport system substrate-binding protein